MLTKKQVHILSVFKKDLFASLTFRQVKQQGRQRSNNLVQTALKELRKEGILTPQETGDVTTYQLSFTPLALAYLNLINETDLARSKIPKDVLENIRIKILKQTEFFILIVFGSYAKNEAHERSDLDIAVIVESEQSKKDIAPSVETVKRREVLPIDCHIFTRTEFREMLKTEFENVGKQIVKNSLVYSGYLQYCELLRGIKHG